MKKQKGIFSVMSLLIFLFLHPSFSYAESVESYRDILVEGIIGNPSVVKNEPLVSEFISRNTFPKLFEVTGSTTVLSILGILLVMIVIDICWIRRDNQ